MLPRDWQLFLQKGQGKEMAIAQVSKEIAIFLGAYSDKVFIHHDYAIKAAEKHGVSPEDLCLLFDVVEYGRALADRERHVTFLCQTSRGWFQVTVKRAEASRRLYISTFYKTNRAEADRKSRKYKVIRKDKGAA